MTETYPDRSYDLRSYTLLLKTCIAGRVNAAADNLAFILAVKPNTETFF